MASTETLVAEHRIILDVLAALERALANTGPGRAVPVALLHDVVAFSRGFIDRCHHGKEEGCLLPCLARRGIPSDHALVQQVLREHEAGRTLTRRMAQALDRVAQGTAPAEEALEPCRQLVELLRAHIMTEHEALFPLSDAVMSAANHDETERCFARTEETIGPGEHARLIRLAEEIAERS